LWEGTPDEILLIKISLVAVRDEIGLILKDTGRWQEILPEKAILRGCEVTETEFLEMLESDGASMPDFDSIAA